ncbi:unnamed protein product [Nesidiocoris tenuis]|uniref:BZIP domain-containing protein n=1 Tax=Nesidiocoris tenuis TaxID=355587 RepID=A0A6H5H4L4_9HEMI|nr:unnamed protein product [Nesidiocoris tenuis]
MPRRIRALGAGPSSLSMLLCRCWTTTDFTPGVGAHGVHSCQGFLTAIFVPGMASIGMKSQQRLLADCSTGLGDGSDVQWDSQQQAEPSTSNLQISNASVPKTEVLPSSNQKSNVLPGFWTLPATSSYPRPSTDRTDQTVDEVNQTSWLSAIQNFAASDGRHAYPESYGKMQHIDQDLKQIDDSFRQKDPPQGTVEHFSKAGKLNFQENELTWPEAHPTSTSNFQPFPLWTSQTGEAANLKPTKSYAELTSKQTNYKNFPIESSRVLNSDRQKAETHPCEGHHFGAKFHTDSPTWHTPQMPQLCSPLGTENSFRGGLAPNRKWPCCYGAHRQNSEHYNSPRIQKTQTRIAPNMLAAARDTKPRVSWFDDERSAAKIRGSPEPRIRLRTYEADSTSAQIPDNSTDSSIQKPSDPSLSGSEEQSKPRDFNARYGFARKPYEINYPCSVPQVGPTSQTVDQRGPMELKRNYQMPYDSQPCPTVCSGDFPENQRRPWAPPERTSTAWLSDAALEEKRRRNREASARCEEKRKWKTEQLKKDNQYVREAAVKLFEENQRLWERLERLKRRPRSAFGQNPSETGMN